MSTTLDATTAGLFLLVVFPGLVSTTIYRLIMPARALDWGNALLQGLFYSTINFVLGLPLLYWLALGYDPMAHPVRYFSAAILLLFVTPLSGRWSSYSSTSLAESCWADTGAGVLMQDHSRMMGTSTSRQRTR
jgi:hypothetical protein